MRALAPTPAARAEEVADAVSASAANFFHDYVADMQARGVTSYGRVKGTLIDGKYALLPFLVARHGGMPRAGDVTSRTCRLGWQRAMPGVRTMHRIFVLTLSRPGNGR